MPRPEGHHPNHLAFKGFWGMKTPKGWSLLVVHPLNRHDLPWTITSGIMDADDDCPLDSGLVEFKGCPDKDDVK